MSEPYLYISTHEEFRGRGDSQRTVYVYTPQVIPAGGNSQSLNIEYCVHRHTSYDAAQRCGKSMLAKKLRESKKKA